VAKELVVDHGPVDLAVQPSHAVTDTDIIQMILRTGQSATPELISISTAASNGSSAITPG